MAERRSLYRVADPSLSFWYRFVAPLSFALQFSDPRQVYNEQVAQYVADYMGRHVFENICEQWLRRHGRERLGLTINSSGCYWSRDGKTETHIVVQLENGSFLFGECKWRSVSGARLSHFSKLHAKVASLPNEGWKNEASYILFSVGTLHRSYFNSQPMPPSYSF